MAIKSSWLRPGRDGNLTTIPMLDLRWMLGRRWQDDFATIMSVYVSAYTDVDTGDVERLVSRYDENGNN